MIQLAEQTWRYTCVVRACPEQLPQAMFLCSAFGCFTASSWALISFQTAGVLTNQAFHVSLSFTLFCFTIHTWTPKRTDKILSFSEAINDQQQTWLKWVFCLLQGVLNRLWGKGSKTIGNCLCLFCHSIHSLFMLLTTLHQLCTFFFFFSML